MKNLIYSILLLGGLFLTACNGVVFLKNPLRSSSGPGEFNLEALTSEHQGTGRINFSHENLCQVPGVLSSSKRAQFSTLGDGKEVKSLPDLGKKDLDMTDFFVFKNVFDVGGNPQGGFASWYYKELDGGGNNFAMTAKGITHLCRKNPKDPRFLVGLTTEINLASRVFTNFGGILPPGKEVIPTGASYNPKSLFRFTRQVETTDVTSPDPKPASGPTKLIQLSHLLDQLPSFTKKFFVLNDGTVVLELQELTYRNNMINRTSAFFVYKMSNDPFERLLGN